MSPDQVLALVLALRGLMFAVLSGSLAIASAILLGARLVAEAVRRER